MFMVLSIPTFAYHLKYVLSYLMEHNLQCYAFQAFLQLTTNFEVKSGFLILFFQLEIHHLVTLDFHS